MNESIRQFIALNKNNQIKNKLIIGLTSYKKFNYFNWESNPYSS